MAKKYLNQHEKPHGYPEKLSRYLFDQSPFSIQIFSPDGWRLYVNKAGERFFGITIEKDKDYNILHDEQLLKNGFMPYIRRGFAGEVIAAPAIKYDIDAGVPGVKNVRWLRAFIYPAMDHGAISEVIVMHEDITLQIEADILQQEREKQLRTIIDSLPALIAVIGKDYRYRFCNKTYEEWFGKPVDKIIGTTISEIIGHNAFNQIKGKFLSALEGNIENYEGYIIYSDGTERYLNATFLPNVNNKQIDEIFLLVKDRTAHKKAEEEALHHHTELAHLARVSTISELATGLAHELNQPLTTIKLLSRVGLLQLETDASDHDKLSASLESIGSQAIRAGEIIRHLRRLIAKKNPMRTAVNLNALIQETVSFIGTELRKANIKVGLDLQKDLPQVFADKIQIQQVLINLLINSIDAIKKTKDRNGEIIVSSCLGDGQQAMITVTDTGCGIDQDTLVHMFDSFFSTKGDMGIGIGLSISKSLIEKHGGKICAETVPGKGAKLMLTLPLYSRDLHK